MVEVDGRVVDVAAPAAEAAPSAARTMHARAILAAVLACRATQVLGIMENLGPQVVARVDLGLKRLMTKHSGDMIRTVDVLQIGRRRGSRPRTCSGCGPGGDSHATS